VGRTRAVLRDGHGVAIAAQACCYRCGKLRIVIHHHDLGQTRRFGNPM